MRLFRQKLFQPHITRRYSGVHESLGRGQLELYLAGKLDVLVKHRAVEHAHSGTDTSSYPFRARASYVYAADGTSVCKTVYIVCTQCYNICAEESAVSLGSRHYHSTTP